MKDLNKYIKESLLDDEDDLAEISCINKDKSFHSTFEMYGSFTIKIKEELQNLDMDDKAINSYINKKYGGYSK